jgi:C-terminal processing protease CtpA/Prc
VNPIQTFTWHAEQPNAARIGVYLGENGLRDTLGVLISSVVDDGPAAKAGLKEGDRIQSVGNVNLRMTRVDAEDAMLNGLMGRRLVRELDKLKAGDEVELRVWSDGSAKTLRIKTVAASELATSTARSREPLRYALQSRGARNEDRAALGLSVGGSATKRDTLGVFVVRVTSDGPAEQAGIVEGDRIARINDIDLRVPAQDAGDAQLTQARVRRLNQEIGKLSAGDAVTLTVVSGGRQREVRVTAVKASELHDESFGFYFGDGAHFEFPHLQVMPRIQTIPRGGTFQFDGGRAFQFDGGRIRADVREEVERALEQARRAVERVRQRTVRSEQ